jgi:uncharacterized damage-inducible protein DinB
MEFQLENGIEILARTPSTLNAMLGGLSDAWLFSNEGDDTWSAFDIIGHLIHGEEADWIPRARIILEHGEARPFAPFDRFAMLEASKGRSLEYLLNKFQTLRAVSLDALNEMDLTPEMLATRGKHPELGVVTLSQLLSTWVTHDLGHVAQIARVMAKQYAEAVGPWHAFLPVLTR